VVQPAPSRRLIQQVEYTPPRTYKGVFDLEDPINFSVDGVLGISISQATDGICPMLDGRDDRMVVFKNSSIQLRMQVGKVNSQTSILPTPFLLALRLRSVYVKSKRS